MIESLDALLSYKGLAVFAWLAVFFVGERLLPAAPYPAEIGGPLTRGALRRLLRNGGLWAMNVGLSLSIVIPISFWASENALLWRPGWWSGWPGLVLDVLLLDFLIYWWHRANHVVPFLWRFHEIHHLDRFLDSTSAVRFHFGEVLLSATARAAVILAFGIPIVSVLVFESLVLFGAIFHHSNLRVPAGLESALSRIVITPRIHWVHHHAVRADTDSNYGTILSVWDRLFGSRSPNRRRPGMPIGVEGHRERGLLDLLLLPFFGRAFLKRRAGAKERVSTGG